MSPREFGAIDLTGSGPLSASAVLIGELVAWTLLGGLEVDFLAFGSVVEGAQARPSKSMEIKNSLFILEALLVCGL